MKTLAVIDTETTGLDPSKDACIEVACVLYDIEHCAPIESYASLIRAKGNAAEAVNRIAPSLLESAPRDGDVAALPFTTREARPLPTGTP